MRSRFTEQCAVCNVHVALKALDLVRHVRLMIDLMAGILGYNVLGFVALDTRSSVDLSSENGSAIASRETNRHITRSVHMGFEFPYNPRL